MSVLDNLSLEQKPKQHTIKPVINESSSSSPSSRCGHWFVRHGVCTACKSTVEKDQAQPFDYLFSNVLQLSHKAVAAMKRFTTSLSCSKDKKLNLVLDLDHTLLHTARLTRLTKAEKYLIKEAPRNDLWEWTTRGVNPVVSLTKLRPFVRRFLEEASKMFTMWVYTKGTRRYANLILKLIDPKRIYFRKRVITREESPDVKTLDLVLGHERGTLIVDDSPEVWPDHKSNLIVIRRYYYFRRSNNGQYSNSKAYSEEKSDESEKDGGLARVLKLLKEVHCAFFSVKEEKELESQDVRLLLQEIKSNRVHD